MMQRAKIKVEHFDQDDVVQCGNQYEYADVDSPTRCSVASKPSIASHRTAANNTIDELKSLISKIELEIGDLECAPKTQEMQCRELDMESVRIESSDLLDQRYKSKAYETVAASDQFFESRRREPIQFSDHYRMNETVAVADQRCFNSKINENDLSYESRRTDLIQMGNQYKRSRMNATVEEYNDYQKEDTSRVFDYRQERRMSGNVEVADRFHGKRTDGYVEMSSCKGQQQYVETSPAIVEEFIVIDAEELVSTQDNQTCAMEPVLHESCSITYDSSPQHHHVEEVTVERSPHTHEKIVEKEVIKEVIKEVPVIEEVIVEKEVIKEVEVEVPVIKEVIVEREIIKEVFVGGDFDEHWHTITFPAKSEKAWGLKMMLHHPAGYWPVVGVVEGSCGDTFKVGDHWHIVAVNGKIVRKDNADEMRDILKQTDEPCDITFDPSRHCTRTVAFHHGETWGISIDFGRTRNCVVVQCLGGVAQESGIKIGCKLLAIDGMRISPLNQGYVKDVLRARKNCFMTFDISTAKGATVIQKRLVKSDNSSCCLY